MVTCTFTVTAELAEFTVKEAEYCPAGNDERTVTVTLS
jgi:hypothetical protein